MTPWSIMTSLSLRLLSFCARQILIPRRGRGQRHILHKPGAGADFRDKSLQTEILYHTPPQPVLEIVKGAIGVTPDTERLIYADRLPEILARNSGMP
jgi:hypothetical protein